MIHKEKVYILINSVNNNLIPRYDSLVGNAGLHAHSKILLEFIREIL